MEIIDMNKLEIAIKYIERITEGKNPVNNALAEDDAVLNNPNVIRCMFFVKEVLECVKRNDGYIGLERLEGEKEPFPCDQVHFEFRENKTVTKFVQQLNESVDLRRYQRLSFKPITEWLLKMHLLEEVDSGVDQKKMKLPTEEGTKFGLLAEERQNQYGRSYPSIVYSKKAQEYIAEHLDAIVNGDM